MWEAFPIQTHTDRGEDCQTIIRGFVYTAYPEVTVSVWKDVPVSVKTWCFSIWNDTFGTVRYPLGDEDVLGWIPQKGTIIAKRGIWIGQSRSRPIVYVNCLHVADHVRGQRLAEKLIHSIGVYSTTHWNIPSFLFEVAKAPKSITDRGAEPIYQFSYMWITFTSISKPPKWKRVSPRKCLDLLKGFHGSYAGWRAYFNEGNYIVFDAHNDIVWYTSYALLHTFDGFPIGGAYCRVTTKFGTTRVYAQNMYFTPKNEVYILG
jgi:hypothetical protein